MTKLAAGGALAGVGSAIAAVKPIVTTLASAAGLASAVSSFLKDPPKPPSAPQFNIAGPPVLPVQDRQSKEFALRRKAALEKKPGRSESVAFKLGGPAEDTVLGGARLA
jgi:hypothetical protein